MWMRPSTLNLGGSFTTANLETLNFCQRQYD